MRNTILNLLKNLIVSVKKYKFTLLNLSKLYRTVQFIFKILSLASLFFSVPIILMFHPVDSMIDIIQTLVINLTNNYYDIINSIIMKIHNITAPSLPNTDKMIRSKDDKIVSTWGQSVDEKSVSESISKKETDYVLIISVIAMIIGASICLYNFEIIYDFIVNNNINPKPGDTPPPIDPNITPAPENTGSNGNSNL